MKLEVRKCGEGLIGRPIEGEESKAIATLAVEEMMVVVESKEEEVTQVRRRKGWMERLMTHCRRESLLVTSNWKTTWRDHPILFLRRRLVIG